MSDRTHDGDRIIRRFLVADFTDGNGGFHHARDEHFDRKRWRNRCRRWRLSGYGAQALKGIHRQPTKSRELGLAIRKDWKVSSRSESLQGSALAGAFVVRDAQCRKPIGAHAEPRSVSARHPQSKVCLLVADDHEQACDAQRMTFEGTEVEIVAEAADARQAFAQFQRRPDLQEFWQEVKSQESANIRWLKDLVQREIEQKSF